MDIQQFEGRKKDHIEHALNTVHQAVGLSGFEQVSLTHEALPDFDFSDVNIHTDFHGTRLKTPFYIAAMTAGHSHGIQLNRTLAEAAQTHGWIMGIGSQRRNLIDAKDSISEWSDFRRRFPSLKLLSNIGITQLASAKTDDILRICDSVQADFLFVHLNALQEVLQPEGTPNFKNSLQALERLCRELKIPIGVKETGCGFSIATLNRLKNIGLQAIDVSGLGGTHWGRMEGARATANSVQAKAAETFANWGIPTHQSIRNANSVLSSTTEIWASGGIRNGLDAAKALALGANRVGYAQPALKAAIQGESQLNHWMETQEFELKVALFCTGARTIESLRKGSFVWTNNEK